MASTPFPAPLSPQTGSLSWPSAATIRPNLASQTSPSPPAPTSCRCIPPASTPAQPTASLFASTAANFAASTPGPGSVLLIAGTARTTTCNSVTECTAPVTAADVSVPGNLSVQVRNPDGTTSNSVSLLVAAPNASDEIISLTSAAPSATAKDIIVVDPTTAGVSLPNADVDLNVAALGVFSTTANSCSLAGNPVPLQRPATGVVAADICLFSASGLDTSMTYTVTGPGDVTVI